MGKETKGGITTEDKKKLELTDDQLEEVSGGETVQAIAAQPMRFKCCAADPTHVYVSIHDACSIYGCFTGGDGETGDSGCRCVCTVAGWGAE